MDLHRATSRSGPDGVSMLTAAWAEIVAMAPAGDDAGRIDQVAAAERLINAAAGLIAETSVAFADSQIDEQRQAGVRTRMLGRGTAEQLSLARRTAPKVAQHDLGVARSLGRLPRLRAAFRRGDVSSRIVNAVVHEWSHLSDRDALTADAQLDGELDFLSPRQAGDAARCAAQHLDPAGAAARMATAVGERHTTVRPLPDTMARFSAVLPAGHAVAVAATLDRLAKQRRSDGDERTLAQLRSDLAVERLTGRDIDADGRLSGRPGVLAATIPADVELQIVMTSDALLGATDAPALLRGFGAIPATLARQMITVDPPLPAQTSLTWEQQCERAVGFVPVAHDTSDLWPHLDPDRRHPNYPPSWPWPPRPPDRDRAAAPPDTRPDTSPDTGPDMAPDTGPDTGPAPGAAELLGPSDPGFVPPRRDFPGGHWEPIVEPADDAPDPAQRRACERWLRRLFTDPVDDTVVAVDRRTRSFSGTIRRLIAARDQACRQPFCDSDIAHVDHVVPHRHRGPTSAGNGEGVCAGFNYVKELPGWDVRPSGTNPRTLTITTPTGHTYESPTPPVFGRGTARSMRPTVERLDVIPRGAA